VKLVELPGIEPVSRLRTTSGRGMENALTCGLTFTGIHLDSPVLP
jgi:hypothetical protein